ncbi:protein POOR HOMOLOGOUS SYNAPSIS 1 [Sesamum angolense]|uniref:Protein POOR HOMOLOGOUS SYNAPSIS 1 n=1 Tax=Sesamum angolense TaxID=2727404 RepID=A0AAE2BW75_9LAMI|nr:protein POOR HOMOLOGOUS SYNAPSIS 1 [Sesamum angolense]
MAGSAVTTTTTTTNLELETPAQSSQSFAMIDQWQVQYARFINYSSSTLRRTHPSLTPIAKSRLRRGTWMSTVGGCLKLIYEQSSTGWDDAVLVLSLESRVLARFRWIELLLFQIVFLGTDVVPCRSKQQSPCIAYPVGFTGGALHLEDAFLMASSIVFIWFSCKGSRAVLIEKFALRFFTIYETDKFMNLVKEILENGRPKLLRCPEFYSELSSQAEDQGGLAVHSISTNPTELPSSVLNAAQDSESYERMRDYEAADAVSEFPPSFTELLKNCLPAVSEAEKPTESGADLKTQFMRYLEGTSFKELLATVENVVSEIGDDIVL